MFTIENDTLIAVIRSKGAELSRIYHKKNGLEYLWNADPAFWNKHSPILFPIVGTLKENTYHFDEKPYSLTRHGFARDMDFVVMEEKKTTLLMSLADSQGTFEKYPFHFRFDIHYKLEGSRIKVTYKVLNTGGKTMYFSVGGHPAFRVPLDPKTNYSDYYLAFSETENADRWPISPDGLIEKTPLPLLNQADQLPLTKELFSKDALVLKNLRSTRVSLLSSKTPHGIEFDFAGFPYLGLWAAKGADFVCIEPWCGIADSVDSNQQLAQKEGIEMLAPGQVFQRTWSCRFF